MASDFAQFLAGGLTGYLNASTDEYWRRQRRGGRGPAQPEPDRSGTIQGAYADYDAARGGSAPRIIDAGDAQIGSPEDVQALEAGQQRAMDYRDLQIRNEVFKNEETLNEIRREWEQGKAEQQYDRLRFDRATEGEQRQGRWSNLNEFFDRLSPEAREEALGYIEAQEYEGAIKDFRFRIANRLKKGMDLGLYLGPSGEIDPQTQEAVEMLQATLDLPLDTTLPGLRDQAKKYRAALDAEAELRLELGERRNAPIRRAQTVEQAYSQIKSMADMGFYVGRFANLVKQYESGFIESEDDFRKEWLSLMGNEGPKTDQYGQPVPNPDIQYPPERIPLPKQEAGGMGAQPPSGLSLGSQGFPPWAAERGGGQPPATASVAAAPVAQDSNKLDALIGALVSSDRDVGELATALGIDLDSLSDAEFARVEAAVARGGQ